MGPRLAEPAPPDGLPGPGPGEYHSPGAASGPAYTMGAKPKARWAPRPHYLAVFANPTTQQQYKATAACCVLLPLRHGAISTGSMFCSLRFLAPVPCEVHDCHPVQAAQEALRAAARSRPVPRGAAAGGPRMEHGAAGGGAHAVQAGGGAGCVRVVWGGVVLPQWNVLHSIIYRSAAQGIRYTCPVEHFL